MRILKSISVLSALLFSVSILGQSKAERHTVLCFDYTQVSAIAISADDAPVSFTFSFRNNSKDTVWITDVLTSCSCTTARFSSDKIAPNQAGKIALTYNPKLKSGDLFQQAFIYTNLSGEEEDVVLELKGRVTPTANPFAGFSKQLGIIRLKQEGMSFRFKKEQKFCTEQLLCINAGEQSLQLSTTSYPFLTFTTEPNLIEIGAEADIIITVDADKWKEMMGDKKELLLPIKGMGSTTDTLKLEVLFSE